MPRATQRTQRGGPFVALLLLLLAASRRPPWCRAHPWATHVGPRSRAFWELAAARGHEPRVLAAWPRNSAPLLPLLADHAAVGFCPYRVLHDALAADQADGATPRAARRQHRVTRLVCAKRHAGGGCVQLYEDAGWLGADGDGGVEAGCLYLDEHRHSVMSQDW